MVQLDSRTPLTEGFKITLGHITYTIEKLIGFGGNAFVYLAGYEDNILKDRMHNVLIKELFPYHPKNLIYRSEDGSISFKAEVKDYFSLHRESFLHGNACHLDIQNIRGDMASVNINSYEKNGTLYTVLGNLSSDTLLLAVEKGGAISSPLGLVYCMLGILDALEVFHKNGFLHLDISPGNILMMPADKNEEYYRRMILIDYNSTWKMNEFEENANVYFSIKEHYSAPEVRLQDKNSISQASDLFSVCAIFFEYLRGKPLDFSLLYSRKGLLKSDMGMLAKLPATAAAKAAAIIRKGLKLPPGQRYQSIEELRADFKELKNRIKGIGITHSALWEASNANFQKHIRKNRQYEYLFKEDALLPCNVKLTEDSSCSIFEGIKALSKGASPHVQITAGGGMGKTTSLMLLWKDGIKAYDPGASVPLYIPLYNYREASIPYIRGCLLERLRFDEKTTTVEDALRALDILLDTAAKGRPSVQLLLDGLNEVSGDKKLLLVEINELMKKPGVQIILASRAEDEQLKLNTLEIMELTEYEIKHYLKGSNVLYPADKALQHIIANHMMLSIYRDTCIMEQRAVDVHSALGLLEKYINSLLSAHREHNLGSRMEQLEAEYAVSFLLPSIVYRMKISGSCVLPANEVYMAVQDSYKMLTQKSFLMCFPHYIGKSKLIRGGANTPEEWFDDIVSIILCNKFALLYSDGDGNYTLPHQNFHDYFIKKYEENRKRLSAAKKKLAIPYIAAMLLAIVFFTFAWVKVADKINISYPETVQERRVVENAMTAVADSLGRLGMQLQGDRDVLNSYSEGYKEFDALYNRNKRVKDTLVLDEPYSDDRVRLFMPEDSPLPFTILKDLLNGANDYNKWSEGMFESLKVALGDGSIYPEKDRLAIIDLYKQYLDSYENICYIRMQLAILPLNDYGRKPVLDELPYMTAFGDKFAVQPFMNNKAELESALKAEEVKLRDISAKIKSYGMKG